MAKKTSSADATVYLQNSVKTLATNIRFASVDNPVNTLVVTSSIPNEGKSTIAIALAEALSTGGRTVLLVECDMRRRSLGNMLGLHVRNGIYSVLAGQVPLEQAVVQTTMRGVYFLDSEPHIPNPVDILGSKRFQSFVASLGDTYDYVVFDTPPLSAFVDAAVVGSIVDGALLVVRRNFTKRDEVVSSFEQLKKAGANVLGTVLNFCDAEKSEYYYEYYTKDGERRKRKKRHDASNVAPEMPSNDWAATAPSFTQGAPLQSQAPAPAPAPTPAPAPAAPAAGTTGAYTPANYVAPATTPAHVAPVQYPVQTNTSGFDGDLD